MSSLGITVWNTLAFLTGVIATAILTRLVTRWWQRARPSVRILAVSLGPKLSSEEATVAIDFPLIQRERASPILPQLEGQMRVVDLREFVDRARIALAAHRSVMTHIADLSSRTHVLEQGCSKDEQRERVLREWQTFGNDIEALGLAAIRHFDAEIPEVLKEPYPEEWKDPRRARLHLTETRDYNLAEIDVDAELKRRMSLSDQSESPELMRSRLEGLNVMRRLWIHLNEEDIRWLFRRIILLSQGLDQNATEVIAEVQQILEKETPHYVRVDALLTNDGARNMSVQPFAFLTLPILEDRDPPDGLIPLELDPRPSESQRVELVPGNDARRLMYYSTDDTQCLSVISPKEGDQHLEAERLQAIFTSKVVPCRLACAVERFADHSPTYLLSQPSMLGADVGKRMREALAQFAFNPANQ